MTYHGFFRKDASVDLFLVVLAFLVSMSGCSDESRDLAKIKEKFARFPEVSYLMAGSGIAHSLLPERKRTGGVLTIILRISEQS